MKTIYHQAFSKSIYFFIGMTLIFATINCATKEYSSTSLSVSPLKKADIKAKPSKKNIDYLSFVRLTKKVEDIRVSRLVEEDKFIGLMKKKGTILLDTRSKQAYDGLHIKGAVHLNFSDFTEEKLAKVIPSKASTVLIYCNNNFFNDPLNFARKMPPLALNIPTFINLYGYGYENLYELKTPVLIDPTNSQLEFEGSNAKIPIGRKLK